MLMRITSCAIVFCLQKCREKCSKILFIRCSRSCLLFLLLLSLSLPLRPSNAAESRQRLLDRVSEGGRISYAILKKASEEKIVFVNQSHPLVPLLEKSYDRAKLMPISPVSGSFDPLAPAVKTFLFPQDLTQMTPLEIADVATLPLLLINKPAKMIKIANEIDDAIRAERIAISKTPRAGEWVEWGEKGAVRQETLTETLSCLTKESKVFPEGQFDEVRVIIEDGERWLKLINREDDAVYFVDHTGEVFNAQISRPFKFLENIKVKLKGSAVSAYEFIKRWLNGL